MSYTRGISEPAGPLMVEEFYSLARRTKGTAARPRGAHPGLAAHKATGFYRWNIEMPATPAAPASMQSAWNSLPLLRLAPAPGIATARASSRKRSSPSRPPFNGVWNTGPNTAKSAPSDSAARSSSMECVETPTRKTGGTMLRKLRGAIEAAGRCTPCAPAASAISTRELIRIFAPCGFGSANTRRVNSHNSSAGRNPSRESARALPD